ncbi:MAG: putative enzyme related to lactoylglutathione lyase [Pirellulaceae bacterium]|jgi:predicted enzyme related to lactoylglutathione lyase
MSAINIPLPPTKFAKPLTGNQMKIYLTTVFVHDQAKALDFYTSVLGFVKQNDIPQGAHRWLTVVSPEGAEGVELLLEPNELPAAQTYQRALFEEGIPVKSFAVDDIENEHDRLKKLGVEFTMDPTAAGAVKLAVFNDTCGNLIQLVQM